MHIDHNSYGSIALAWLICAVLIIIARLLIGSSPVFWVIAAVILMIAVWQTLFFRVPVRKAAGSASVITAVADGKIVIKKKVFEPQFLNRECIQVSIFMDFFDVHANFWPMTGDVSYYKYHPGHYFLAFHPKASELNEHSSTALRNAHGEIFFKQIAGTFARRIVCYSKPGAHETAGEQCGIIKFGSRIDMFLPLDAEIKVKVGDLTRASETVIAVLK